jgi:hypothetical protein
MRGNVAATERSRATNLEQGKKTGGSRKNVSKEMELQIAGCI